MKTIAHLQGSPEWLAHRRTTRNASDAPAMMGASPYVTRAELIRRYATGLEREIDAATQKVFDRGHEVEPALRAMAEQLIGEWLYPITGVRDDGYLGASFDGVTLGEDRILEAKQANATKLECVARNEIPHQDYWQIVQQFAVCESANRCLYMVGDGTEAGTRWMFIERHQVAHDIPKLIASWQQFDADVAAYVPEPVAAPAPTGRAPDSLPALSVQVTGMVTASNLDDFKKGALQVLGNINRDLKTDEDFADAEQTVKWCKAVEERLDATKQQVLGQTADIDAVFRTIDEVSAEARRIRLELGKLVDKEKENRRLEIVTSGRTKYDQHIADLKAETKGVWLPLPAPDFAGAIKGKKSLSSMQDAVDTALAICKIAANEWAAHIRAALACLSEETTEHKHLFPDYLSFIGKPIEDIRALVRGRIAEHKAAEDARLERERERIRQEEAEKLEAEQRQREADAAKHAEPAPPIRGRTGDWDSGRLPDGDRGGQPGFAGHVQGSSSPEHPAAAAPSTARIKLGDINACIAPLTISADGLAALGFKPVETKGGAKLYAGEDFPRICTAMTQVISAAISRAAEKLAA